MTKIRSNTQTTNLVEVLFLCILYILCKKFIEYLCNFYVDFWYLIWYNDYSKNDMVVLVR